MNDFRDRPEDGIGLMDSALGVLVALVITCIAVAASWFIGLIFYGAREDFEPQITAKHEREVAEKREMSPCDFSLVQYGPDRQRRNPECVNVKGGPLPRHVLTLPVEPRK